MVDNQKDNKEDRRRRGFAWWWLILPAAAVAAWFFFGRKGGGAAAISPQAEIKICTLAQTGDRGHCCSADLPQVSIFESNSVLYVTASLPAFKGKKPNVTGTVYWESGETFPAKPIVLTLDEAIGDLCYIGVVQPLNGIPWSLKKYVLKLQADGQPIGEKAFEMVR